MSATSVPVAVVVGAVIFGILMLVNRKRGMPRVFLIVSSVVGGVAVALVVYFVKGRAQ
jgi:hypothetical protein